MLVTSTASLLPTPFSAPVVLALRIVKRSRLLFKFMLAYVTRAFRVMLWWATDKAPSLLVSALDPIRHVPFIGLLFSLVVSVLRIARYLAMRAADLARRWMNLVARVVRAFIAVFTGAL